MNGRPSSGGLPPNERRVIEAMRAAFPGSRLERVPKIERGAPYLSKEREEVLQQVGAIARERGRDDDEARVLLSQAARMAAEQLLARKAR